MVHTRARACLCLCGKRRAKLVESSEIRYVFLASRVVAYFCSPRPCGTRASGSRDSRASMTGEIQPSLADGRLRVAPGPRLSLSPTPA